MNDLAKQEPQEDKFLALIEKVVFDPDVDVSKMSAILEMQEKIFDKNAVIAFNKAMVACQTEMPIVAAKTLNDQTKSRYAKYEHLLIAIKPVYTKYGFSLSFGQDLCSQKDHITIVCDVIHSEGYCKRYQATLPLDSCGIKGAVNKTEVHATSSAFSYAKRYLATMIFNIAIADQDDDAVKAGGITIEQLLDYNFEVRKHIQTIAVVKDGIFSEDLSRAAEAWYELEQDEQKALWRAQTKGGIFTTDEQKTIKSSEFRIAHFGEANQ